jgi:hypothetical protein
MLSISSTKGSLELQAGKQTIVVFPDAARKPAEGELLLLGSPEEEPRAGTISWPGEYDIDGVAISGIGHEEGKSVSYALQVDGVRFGFLVSPLNDWTDAEMEMLGTIDVLCVPSDNPKAVQKIVDDVDPRVLVPYKTGGADKYAETLKVCGATGKESVEKYVIKSGSFGAEGREVVLLEERK